MKSRRKIWSIPIALAVVLALIASAGVTSFVLAQATGSKTVTVADGTNRYFDATTLVLGTEDGQGVITGGTAIATVEIPDGDEADDPDTDEINEAIDGLNTASGQGVTPVVTGERISGFGLSGTDAGLFRIDRNGDSGDDERRGTVRIKNADALAAIIDPSKKGVFKVDVLIYVDRDTASDSGRGFRGEGSPPDAPSGESATPADEGDDRDEVNKVSLTIHAFKLDRTADGLLFAAIPEEAERGDRILGPNGEMKVITVVGLPSAGKLTSTNPSGYTTVVDDNTVYLRYSDTSTVAGADPGASRTAPASVTLTVHTAGQTDAGDTDDDQGLAEVAIVIDLFQTLDFDRVTGDEPRLTTKERRPTRFHSQCVATPLWIRRLALLLSLARGAKALTMLVMKRSWT